MAYGIWKGGINPFDPNSAFRRWIEDTPLDLDLEKKYDAFSQGFGESWNYLADNINIFDPNSAPRLLIENTPLDFDLGKHLNNLNPFDPNSKLRLWIENTPLDLDLGKRASNTPIFQGLLTGAMLFVIFRVIFVVVVLWLAFKFMSKSEVIK